MRQRRARPHNPADPAIPGADDALSSPLARLAARLVDVATGRRPADMVVRGGRWVNVHSGEIIPGTDIAIADGRFAYCGPDASHAIGPATQVIEAEGRYLVPGLCDGHMHVESGMVTVTEFAAPSCRTARPPCSSTRTRSPTCSACPACG